MNQWSAEEERLLRHEAFVAELIKTHKGLASENTPRPAWQRFLESAGGAALVTVLLGTLAAGVINALVQDKIKERGLKLVSYSGELKQIREIDTGILDLTGKLMSATENLIALTSNVFDPQKFSGTGQKANTIQRTQVRQAWNAADEKWSVEGEKFALLLRLHGQTDVLETWRSAQMSVNAYMDCGESWYLGHSQAKTFVTPEEVRSVACKKEKNAAKESLDNLASAMAKAAQASSQ